VRLKVGRSAPVTPTWGSTEVKARSWPAAKKGLAVRLPATSNWAAMLEMARELGVSA
jgi:hypothetical protein